MKYYIITLVIGFLIFGIFLFSSATESGPTIVGSYNWQWTPTKIEPKGTIACCANGQYGFAVANIYDPAHPYVIDWIDIDGYVRDVSIKGDYAYIIDDSIGFSVIDISDYNNILKIAELNLDGKPKSIECNGNYAYITILKSGLTIVNIDDPKKPHIVSEIQTPGLSYDVKVSGNYAYVADGESGVQIIDISDAAKPSIVSSVKTDGYAHAVDVNNNLLLIADLVECVIAVNISKPVKPRISGRFDNIVTASDLIIKGDYACVVDRFTSVIIVDIKNPGSMKKAGIVPCENVQRISEEDNIIYAAREDSGIDVINLLDKKNPKTIYTPSDRGASSMPELVDNKWFILNMVVQDNYLYATAGDYGLLVFNLDDPETPEFVAHYRAKSCADKLIVQDNYAYVTYGKFGRQNYGIQIFDISTPEIAKLIKTIKTESEIEDMEIYGDYIYLSINRTSSISMINISKPEEPINLVSTIVESGWGDIIDIEDDNLYHYSYKDSSKGKTCINIYSLKSPEKLVRIGTIDANYIVDMKVKGDYLYVFTGFITVYDVSDASKPKLVNEIKGDVLTGMDIDIQDNLACIAGTNGIEIFDISEPALVTVGMKIDSKPRYSTYINCVEISGDYIYTGGFYQGIVVVKYR